MSTVHETLKVNDELSVEFDAIYENGEKYVQENTIWTSADGEKRSLNLYSNELEILTASSTSCNLPDSTRAEVLCEMEYMNALSYHINQDYYFDCLYKYEDDEYRVVQLWNLWYDVNVMKLVSTWKQRYNTFILNWSNRYVGCRSDIVLDSSECFLTNDENVLFPFKLTLDDERKFIHFDVFLFLLYLTFPQYKTDIMRFLKYQPVCTKTSDELFVYNLKQTNKDLLKQLNEANRKLSIMKELEIKLKAHEETLSKQSSEIEELKKQVQDKESALMDSNKEIEALNEKRIEELSRVEDENRAISNELSSTKESLENEKLKTSQWESRYIQLKDIIAEHAQRILKDLGDE